MMMMMSTTNTLESGASSKVKENLLYWAGQWPSTCIFNAVTIPNLTLLLTMGLLSRGLGISMARIFSDFPDWNHAKQYDVGVDAKTGKELPIDPHTAEINRRRNFLERIFIEFVGTILASYVFLQTSQDITAKLLETVCKDKLKPENLLLAAQKLENPLTPEQLAKFEGILKTAFGRNDKFKGLGLDDAKHVIYSKIYGKGNLYTISKALEKEGLEHLLTLKNGGIDLPNSQLGKEFEQQWGLLNPLSVVTVLVGAVGSAWLSGAPVQWANDTLFRDKGMPAILGWWDKVFPVDDAVKKRQKKYPHPLPPKPVVSKVGVPSLNVISKPTAIPTKPITPMQSLASDARLAADDDANLMTDDLALLPKSQSVLLKPKTSVQPLSYSTMALLNLRGGGLMQ
jgi:hypothetical protein